MVKDMMKGYFNAMNKDIYYFCNIQYFKVTRINTKAFCQDYQISRNFIKFLKHIHYILKQYDLKKIQHHFLFDSTFHGLKHIK